MSVASGGAHTAIPLCIIFLNALQRVSALVTAVKATLPYWFIKLSNRSYRDLSIRPVLQFDFTELETGFH